MISYLISCKHDIIYDTVYNIIHVISYHITYNNIYTHFSLLAAADPLPAQRSDAADNDLEPDRQMDFDEERDFADQGPLTDMEMEKDSEITALLLKDL